MPLDSIVDISYGIYDGYTYAKKNEHKVKELEKEGDQLKSKLDIFDTMIKLLKEHPETNS